MKSKHKETNKWETTSKKFKNSNIKYSSCKNNSKIRSNQNPKLYQVKNPPVTSLIMKKNISKVSLPSTLPGTKATDKWILNILSSQNNQKNIQTITRILITWNIPNSLRKLKIPNKNRHQNSKTKIRCHDHIPSHFLPALTWIENRTLQKTKRLIKGQ